MGTMKKCNKKRLFVAIIWMGGLLSASLEYVYSEALPFEYGHQTLYDCRERLPDSGYTRIYTVYLFTVTYALPVAILIFVYSVIGHQIWTHVTPGNAHEKRDLNNTLIRARVSHKSIQTINCK